VIKRGFITLVELEKMFSLFLNSIDWEILDKDGMRFEKGFKYYSNDYDYYIEIKHDKHTPYFNVKSELNGSHILRTVSQKLNLDDLIKYDLIKIYFRN
jgi:hypothetical protein